MTFLTPNTESRRKRVHIERQGSNPPTPVCGGGRAAKKQGVQFGELSNLWQTDIGPCNCKRCKKILDKMNAKASDVTTAGAESRCPHVTVTSRSRRSHVG